MMDTVGDIIRYEDGDMSSNEMVAFFQRIIDNGLVWQLQGAYGRTAKALIDENLCTAQVAPVPLTERTRA